MPMGRGSIVPTGRDHYYNHWRAVEGLGRRPRRAEEDSGVVGVGVGESDLFRAQRTVCQKYDI